MKTIQCAVAICLFFICRNSSSAAIIYKYDFLGNPGSGATTSQTNGQPTGAAFSDFTRTASLTQMPGAPANGTFGTENWNLTGSIDTTQYEGFSITAAGGFHLNLTSLSFDSTLKPSGPANVEVALFLNGSTTAYATLDFTPTSTTTTYNFNFTPLTDADNVTSAAFRFYGWNASATGGGLILDNVATSGAVVPEVTPCWPVTILVGFCLFGEGLRRQRRGRALLQRGRA